MVLFSIFFVMPPPTDSFRNVKLFFSLLFSLFLPCIILAPLSFSTPSSTLVSLVSLLSQHIPLFPSVTAPSSDSSFSACSAALSTSACYFQHRRFYFHARFLVTVLFRCCPSLSLSGCNLFCLSIISFLFHHSLSAEFSLISLICFQVTNVIKRM
jgi:hypothetical protein